MTLKWLPNMLTISRCLLAFVVGWQVLGLDGVGVGQGSLWPFALFVIVAATDFIDGLAARALGAESAFGAFLDPVADKLLVALALLALCTVMTWPWWLVVPTAIIIIRDSYVTLVRLRPSVSLPVTRLAKWKTAAEMVGIGGILLSFGVGLDGLREIAIGLVSIAAALSAYTGGLYLRAAR